MRFMNRWLGIALGLAFTCAASEQSISMSGTILNNNGLPIAGAIVSLSNQTAQDTTDENGAYSLSGTGILSRVAKQSSIGRISMYDGIMTLVTTKAGPVYIDLYDVRGRLLARHRNGQIPAGEYRFSIGRLPSSQITVISVKLGQQTSTFRCISGPDGRGFDSYRQMATVAETHSLVKIAATMDTLFAWKQGYVLGINAIDSYQGVVNDTLDTINLPHFSFFVTSLKAILELAPSDSGFGGDFSFGFTGPGAGLRGADSICSCIAEKSMHGSSVKRWRAFLSVTADARGNRVNAIDRIGTGPWYDFTGKLLAPTIADLKHDRPTNGDPSIANDLPNEDGVPNHQPDPTQDQVDNHHFVTGSKADGTLYSDTSTCDDWTSTTASGKPRCGFSWPRGTGGGMMGGVNWISGFNAGGCARGIELTTNSLNGKIIGNAGGYGGIYCFSLTP
jgi:hypothetical protein